MGVGEKWPDVHDASDCNVALTAAFPSRSQVNDPIPNTLSGFGEIPVWEVVATDDVSSNPVSGRVSKMAFKEIVLPLVSTRITYAYWPATE